MGNGDDEEFIEVPVPWPGEDEVPEEVEAPQPVRVPEEAPA